MEPFMWSKVFDFSGNTIAKTLSFVFKTLAILFIVIGIPALLGWMVYVSLVKPHTNPNPSTTQTAELIENKYYYPNKKVFGLGFNLWGVDIGISKYDYPKEVVTKTTTVTPKTEVKK